MRSYLDIAQARILHQKTDGVAVRAAAETVIELLRRADRERRRFLVMEGAAGAVIRARFFKREVPLDEVNNVDAIEQIAFKGIRNHARLGAGI